MYKIWPILFLLLISSCALQSKNILKSGSYAINSGRQGEKVWNNSLTFQRYSFYREMSLELDIKISKIESSDAFYNWLNEDDRKNFKQCKNTYIVMLYDNFGNYFKNSDVVSEFSKINENVFIPQGYVKNLKLHPAYKQDSLDQYSIYGICNNSENKNLLIFEATGFRPLKISKKELE